MYIIEYVIDRRKYRADADFVNYFAKKSIRRLDFLAA